MEHTPPLKATDQVGLDTLETLSDADNFYNWKFNTIRPFSKGPVLEIGSGIGNVSKFFLNEGFDITLTDLRAEYCVFLEKKFEGHKHLLGIAQIDLVDPDFDKKHAALFGKYNTVFALNVVEHIENDSLAIKNCSKLLQKGGNLIILVPAYNWLYNKFDEELGHYRRYTIKSLGSIFKENNFQIIHKQYFNLAAMFGWFWYGKVLGKKILPKGPVNTYNRLVPYFKIADKTVLNLIGNSVVIVGKKTEG